MVGSNKSVSELQSGALTSWFGKRSTAGCGLFYKFTHIENRLVRWLMEKHGLKESLQDYGMPPADFYQIANAQNCNFLGNSQVSIIWSSQTVKSNIYNHLGRF